MESFVEQILNKRTELRSSPDNDDVDSFNEDLCIFNDLFKEAHYLYSLSSGLRWNNRIQLNETP
ncbi:hypothetical protein, partial [Legionella tunisiensis]|uniref:hypothetical protein n=1 Tax=Legionella tunisiensis TaxID=1034944 RepID=UPI00059325A6